MSLLSLIRLESLIPVFWMKTVHLVVIRGDLLKCFCILVLCGWRHSSSSKRSHQWQIFMKIFNFMVESNIVDKFFMLGDDHEKEQSVFIHCIWLFHLMVLTSWGFKALWDLYSSSNANAHWWLQKYLLTSTPWAVAGCGLKSSPSRFSRWDEHPYTTTLPVTTARTIHPNLVATSDMAWAHYEAVFLLEVVSSAVTK